MRFAVRLDRQVVPAGRTSSHLALQRQQTGLIRLEEVPLEAEVGSPGGIRDYTYETAADVLVICPVSTQLCEAVKPSSVAPDPTHRRRRPPVHGSARRVWIGRGQRASAQSPH